MRRAFDIVSIGSSWLGSLAGDGPVRSVCRREGSRRVTASNSARRQDRVLAGSCTVGRAAAHCPLGRAEPVGRRTLAPARRCRGYRAAYGWLPRGEVVLITAVCRHCDARCSEEPES